MDLKVGMFVSQHGQELNAAGGFPLDGLKHAVAQGAEETLCQQAGHTPAGVLKGGELRELAEGFPPASDACGWCYAEQDNH